MTFCSTLRFFRNLLLISVLTPLLINYLTCSEPVEHNRDSKRSKKVKDKLRDTPRQENVIIAVKGLLTHAIERFY